MFFNSCQAAQRLFDRGVVAFCAGFLVQVHESRAEHGLHFQTLFAGKLAAHAKDSLLQQTVVDATVEVGQFGNAGRGFAARIGVVQFDGGQILLQDGDGGLAIT